MRLRAYSNCDGSLVSKREIEVRLQLDCSVADCFAQTRESRCRLVKTGKLNGGNRSDRWSFRIPKPVDLLCPQELGARCLPTFKVAEGFVDRIQSNDGI